jgi:ABC-type bacteriocin/lantibiotic exporter with double-glycine peptidase domain
MGQEMFIQYLTSLLRSIATPAITYLVAAGYLTDSQTTAAIVIIATVVVNVVWSLANKYFFNKKVEKALELPANSSMSTLNDLLKK